MSKFKIKCAKDENEFMLMIKANDEINAIERVYDKYKVDHAEVYTGRLIDAMQRKQGGIHNMFRRSSKGRGGQVIFS